MKLLLSTIVLLVSFSNFSCELPLATTDLCIKMDWVEGPHLNAGGRRHGGSHMKAMLQKSIVDIAFYVSSDETQTPVSVEGLIVYPWMIMPSGMQHSAPSQLEILEGNIYRLSDLRFMKMMGGHNWEIRFGIENEGTEFDLKNDSLVKTKIQFSM